MNRVFFPILVVATAVLVCNSFRVDSYHSRQPVVTITFRAASRGANAEEYPFQYGAARFFKNGVKFYEKFGGAGGGRGFNIAAVSPLTGELIQPPVNFDTWGTRTTGSAMNEMIGFLNAVPDGTLLLIAVADEAGLNQFDTCTLLSNTWVENGLRALEALGSRQIRSYCYRHSWAMVTVKGEGQASQEQLANAVEVSAQTSLSITLPCPTLAGIDPPSGAAASPVVITGTNFAGVRTVKFSNNVAANFIINSDTQITATVPSAAFTGPITVSKIGCDDVQTETFTVVPLCPTVDSVIPTGGTIDNIVTITGNNFIGVTDLVFTNNVPAQFSITSNSQITTSVPSGAITGPIRILKSGCNNVQTIPFTVTGQPACPGMNGLMPASGAVGAAVSILGNDLFGIASVKFSNDVSSVFTVISATRISTTVPVGAVSGPIIITKTNCNDVLTNTFTVTASTPEVRLYGLNFSPFVDGQDPNLGSHVSKKQIKKRMRIVTPHIEWLRSFGTGGGLDKIGAIAHQLGVRAAIGAWLSKDLRANEEEISRLIEIAEKGQADILVVSSEALFRGDLSESQLIDYIMRVKQAAPRGIPIATAEPYGVLLSHPSVIAAVDVLFMNIYGYWEGVKVEDAIGVLNKKFEELLVAANGKQIYISESGWPSCGNQIGQAIPSPENASLYFKSFVSWASSRAVPYFYFEAFDETFKAKYEGPQGACWGLWDQDGNLKPGIQIPRVVEDDR